MALHGPGGEVRSAGTGSTAEVAPAALHDRQVLTGLALRGMAALLLAGITLLLYLGIGRFVPDGPDLLPPIAAGDAGSGWTASGDVRLDGEDGVALSNGDPDSSAILAIRLPAPTGRRYLALAADLRLQDVVGGRQLWESGRLILVSRTGAAGEWRYDLPHTVIRTTGSMAWRHVDRTFLVPDGSQIQVAVQLLRSTGRLWVRNLSLRPAAERAWFPLASTLLVLCWLLAAAWILWPLAAPIAATLRSRRLAAQPLRLLAVLLTLLAITAGVLVPPEGKQLVRGLAGSAWSAGRSLVTSGSLATPAEQCALPPAGAVLPDLKPLDPQSLAAGPPSPAPDQDFVSPHQMRWLMVDKLGHMAGFALLAFLSLWAARPLGRRGRLLLLAALPAFAGVTETWQVMATTRGASLADVAIDIAGLAIGALAWSIVGAALRLRCRWRGGGPRARG